MLCYEEIQRKLQDELGVSVPEKIQRAYTDYCTRV